MTLCVQEEGASATCGSKVHLPCCGTGRATNWGVSKLMYHVCMFARCRLSDACPQGGLMRVLRCKAYAGLALDVHADRAATSEFRPLRFRFWNFSLFHRDFHQCMRRNLCSRLGTHRRLEIPPGRNASLLHASQTRANHSASNALWNHTSQSPTKLCSIAPA